MISLDEIRLTPINKGPMIQSAFYIQPFFVFPTPELLPVFFERVVHFGSKAFCDCTAVQNNVK